MNTWTCPEERRRLLEHAVAHAAHLLPGQRPIEAFVHHNTLHPFEDMAFEDAVVLAADLYGARAFMPEADFRAAWAEGRVLDRDLDAVLARRVPDGRFEAIPPEIGEREAVRRLMLWLPPDASGPALEWRLAETDALRSLPPWLPRDARERLLQGNTEGVGGTLQRLWAACRAYADRPGPPPAPSRPRDQVILERGQDPDALVHPVLIRWCMAYLDHGQAWWSMPQREEGFYRAMLRVLAQGGVPLRGWMRPLRAQARDLLASGADAADCAHAGLLALDIAEDDIEAVVTATLLALPGWPGMFVQLTERPDLAPGRKPPTVLMDFLAVRLMLDVAALGGPAPAVQGAPVEAVGRDAWRLFHAALLLGLLPEELGEAGLAEVQGLLDRWPLVSRQRLWQLAYERRYRVQVLDALEAHHRVLQEGGMPPTPDAQVVTCIDDREESLRRHLEELDPRWETLGAAGFYGVAMAYRGLHDAHPRPLCPAGLVPRHLVEERPAPEHVGAFATRRASRTRLGRMSEALSGGSRTLLSGGMLALAGLWSLVPLTTRLLAPSLHARVGGKDAPVPTVLTLERDPAQPEKDGFLLGFTVDEMVGVVAGVLKGMGLVRGFAPLVVFLGHGSSSLNNPHEAAHDCGACGGGRGGPNARAFAIMANRPDVRARLRAEGVDIPAETWFVGGYHNTANDAVDWYDLDRVPARHRDVLARLRADLDEARRRDAHERCRRFESAALDLSPTEALRHVEDRAEDLAQPRPEYGHATNALCFVGRRSWSRGLFLDRRVFLTSYDSDTDPDGAVLEGLLASVGPVGAGINLEYWFSFVDPVRYGSGTKLPHNIVGLLGVMDGHASDLRTGLPWQMVEIHEPVRLLVVVEARPRQLEALLGRQPGLRSLVLHRWILLAAFDPETGRSWFFTEDGFAPHFPEQRDLPRTGTSADWYGGKRGHLPPATILAGCPKPPDATEEAA
ncbi:MAG: DUF2309 domain-containing protein [Alphaproteobacteria bacterium]|nr:DUF2309 domain-containing protein [Alphaproteobacteria bacterium]